MKTRYTRKMNYLRLKRLVSKRGWTLVLFGCGRYAGYPQKAQIKKGRFVFTIRTDQADKVREVAQQVEIMNSAL